MAREDIALALKIARERAGMTCKQVGQLLNKSDKTISAWEHCNGQPDADTFIKLCDIYQVPSIDELLGHSSGTTFLADELDLIRRFRKLTVNSKQIVSTLVNLELRHIEANKQGETPIKVIRKEKADAIVKAAILKNDKTVRKMPEHEQEKYFLKVLSQPAAAGYGNYLDDDDFEEIAVSYIPAGTEFGIRIAGDSMEPEYHDGDIVFIQRKPDLDVGEIGIFVSDGEAYCKQLINKKGMYFLHSLNEKYDDIPIDSDEGFYVCGKVLGRVEDYD